MTSRSEKEKVRQIQEKCQVILGQLLREEDNKYCVDCDAKGPRWASWNLGIFLCIRCAGIHRNLGVHISKVKSVNLDTWTPEQVGCLQQMGNSKARAVYEANLPDNFRRPQTDSSLEAFVRAKYEQKKYIAKEWVPPTTPKPAFDIEEEHRKEREKKRTRAKGIPPVEVPLASQAAALPRPHAATTPNAVSNGVSTQKATKNDIVISQSATFDLLGLDNPSNPSSSSSEDPFEAFISAQPVSTAPQASSVPTIPIESSPVNSLTAEQAAKKPVLSKESILSLYSNGGGTSAIPQPTSTQPTFGIPGGMYVAPGAVYCDRNQLQASGTWPLQRPPLQTLEGGGVLLPPGANIANVSQSSLTSASASNPFLSIQNVDAMQQQLTQHQLVQHQLAQHQLAQQQLLQQHLTQTNLGFAQIQQQMTGMNLGGATAAAGWSGAPMMVPGIVPITAPPGTSAWGPPRPPPQGQTLSTNLWQ